MTFIDSSGRKKTLKAVNKYLIDWRGKSLSKIQRAVKEFLEPYWKNCMVFEEFPLVGTRMKFDIYNATRRIILEINGSQHSSFNPFFQKTRANFLGQVKRDLEKADFCARNNIALVEITEKEFYGKTRQELEEFFAEQGVIL